MFEHYTESGRRAIFFARKESGRLGSMQIQCLHVLLGLLNESGTTFLAAGLRGTVQDLVQDLRRALPEARDPIPDHLDLPLSNECKDALQTAAAEAERLGSRHIEPAHLVLALAEKCEDLGRILENHGVERASLMELARRSSH